ncbi:unnamed protein product [Bemisia tabaci]|uniref:Uncharacterized protein n=1 Tax=Bemisia tabaci TaxID=7038 RepID=A0A9P0F272_BEMTA|nr:unnamed protein product [Bemisia tabaci]
MTSAVRFNHNSPENNLDALLEDLQTTISGTKQNGISNGHGPGVKASGYRETIRSHATERDGKLVESNREYDIQYLKPANSTTVLTESSSPTFLDKHDLSSGTKGGNTYKSVSYTYNTSNTGSTNTSRGTALTPSPKSQYTELREKIESSNSPRVGGHVSRIEQRTFEEQHEKRYGTVLPPRTDSETRRELKFVGNSSRDGSLTRPIRDQSPSPVRHKEVYFQESRTTSVNRSSPLPVRSPEPTVITYKYSSTSTERKQYPPTVTHHYELDESRTKVETTTEKPRPFPVTEADKLAHPGHQEPPKQVEELMASFSHSEYQQSIDLPDAPKPRPPTPPPPAPVGPAVNPAPQANGTVGKSKNLAGPPVYYPPGELFTAKGEASMQQSAGGKMKGKMMSKYKYKEGGWRKEKSGTTTIPVCLPLCCAAPCVIM